MNLPANTQLPVQPQRENAYKPDWADWLAAGLVGGIIVFFSGVWLLFWLVRWCLGC
jgi:hypothetical protein